MKKPFWTVSRRRAAAGYVCFVIAYVITAMVTRAVLDSLGGAVWTSIVPPVAGGVAGVIASTIARVQYVNWMGRRLRRRTHGEIPTSFVHWPMWWPLVDATRKQPSLLAVLGAIESQPTGIIPFNTSVADHLTQKARSIVASGVWELVPADRRWAFVESLVRYTDDDDPETLRKLFELGDFETALAYLAVAEDSELAYRALQSGIPVEYVKAAM